MVVIVIINTRQKTALENLQTQLKEKQEEFKEKISLYKKEALANAKEQLYEWYAISNVGVVPSLYEEFGYVVAEMLLHRLPVVAHDTTGIREITDNGKYGLLFRFPEDRKDVSSLRDALLTAIIRTQSKEYEDVKDKGRQRVLENYLIPDFGERMQAVYRSP